MSKQIRENFFSESNEQMLDRLLYDDVKRRTGTLLDDRQKQRLVKTVKHYMGEVYRVNGTGNVTIQNLNKEVLTAVIPDYMSYLRRQTEVETSSVSEIDVITSSDPLKTDVGTRFALMQEKRNEGKAKPPAPPDFRVPLDEEGPAALDLFEQVKKLREAEASRNAQALEEQKKLAVETQLRPIEAGALVRSRAIDNEIPSTLATPPDLRNVLFGNGNGGVNAIKTPYRQSQSGLAEANPTIAVPTVNTSKPVLPQDFVQREDDILNYKENEFNFFAYSADRNWLVSTGENRYNFSILFNAGNPVGTTFRNNTSTQRSFKNITRIELVKCILPVEGVDVMIDISGTSNAFKSSLNTNALSFPYLMVYTPELDNNNTGTNYNLDNAFGVIQYDANWISDNNYASQRGGYIAMIPKFMKCQKVYYPTPLSTLQKITVRIQRPDGTLLSAVPDTLTVSGLTMSQFITGANQGALNYYVGNDSLGAGASRYIWIQTSTWFSRYMFNVGDRIQLQGLNFTTAITGAANVGTAPADLLNFLQNPQGLLVVNIGYTAGATPIYYSGPNNVGYANYIIVDTRYTDPTVSGSTAISPFGGTTAAGTALNTAISGVANVFTTPNGGVINLSHQTQVVFRIITRDMDAASRLRPDNLN